MNKPRVVVIVLHWCTYEDTRECLESLSKTTYPNYDVMLVDNGSNDNSGFRLHEEFPEVDFLRNDKNHGYAEGNNIGMKSAFDKGADQIVVLNSDTIVAPEFLTHMVDITEKYPDTGVVGSKILYFYKPGIMETTGGEINWWTARTKNFGGPDDGRYNEVAERDFVYGTCILIVRKLYEKIGGFDPFFFFNCEDYDFHKRAHDAGFKTMYAPKSRVRHKKGVSHRKVKDNPDTLMMFTKRKGLLEWKTHYRLFQKHLPSPFFLIPFLIWIGRTVFKTFIMMASQLLRGDVKPFIHAVQKIWYRIKVAVTKQ